ncbi:Dml1p [Lachancea thermotolerans CBS 6340]|uniref:Protein DML1 n=1 Tax=Lachancea thermotolerans (strain ATCC 56472 / CBS 6340 / NRRL Y-8284) TaxID=559295 RepID=C5DF55_LACTC|nr:KLTH0D12364p [Lachancea thermotolerans CBS 6340]CAR22810.1 KLTH0D12364p [Lachancea thermotolerans CBS 6340]
MHEIISISASHRTNHVLTQFYNCQEEQLRDLDFENEPGVFLNPVVDRISKTVSYKPRALLWDAKTGNGALGAHQYSSTKDFFYGSENQRPKELLSQTSVKVIQTHEPTPKSEYQTALDTNNPAPPLSDQNSKYWSDYSKLIFGAPNLNTLDRWYHDPNNPSAPDFENLHQTYFDSYEVGFQEFATNYCSEFFDEKLRTQLEMCDELQGINLLSEIDNGWGGFSSSMLSNIRDELPKTDVMTWGFNQDDALSLGQPIHSTKTKFQKLCSKIRSTLSLVQESNLFFPIYSDPQLPLWTFAGRTCMLFDAVNACGSNRESEHRYTFNQMIGKITSGEPQRNIVSTLDIQGLDLSFYSRIPTYKGSSQKTYSHLSILRGKENQVADSFSINTYPWRPSDTIPEQFRSITNYKTNLAVTERPRDVFRHWEAMVSRYFRYDTDREELKEELGRLAETYEEGWYDDFDSGDDV